MKTILHVNAVTLFKGSLGKLLLSMLLSMTTFLTTTANTIVTPATGGLLISADKAANAASPLYTSLGAISLAETLTDDFDQTGGGPKTFILTAPAGWTFNPASGSVTATGSDISSVSLSVSATNIIVSVDIIATSSLDEITISGIEVQSQNGSLLTNNGAIYCATGNAGTADIEGIITTSNADGAGGTNFGSLSQEVGDAAVLVFTVEPNAAVVNAIFGQQPVLVTQDQFGNPSAKGLGTNKNVSIVLSAGTGNLTGTTILDIGTAAGNGTVNFTDLAVDAAGIKKLMASATGLVFAVTNDFTVAQASSSISLATSLTPSCFGINITLTATVLPATATGTVEFFDGATSLGTVALVAGVASFTGNSFTTGSHNFTAVYSGDADYLGNTSNLLLQEISPAAPNTPATIFGSTAICPNATAVNYTITPVADATSYNWSVPVGWTITSGAGSTSITIDANSTGGTISVEAVNSCGSSSAQTLVVSINPSTPAQPGIITGNATPCATTSGLIYSIAPVMDASSYAWVLPTGWSITSGAGTNAITVTAGSFGQDGIISVEAINSCGTSAPQTLSVTVLTTNLSAPGTITGNIEVCPSVTGLNYSVAVVPNASSYNWVFPSGWTITSGSGTNAVTVTSGATSGNISVASVNACTTSSAPQTVAINPVIDTYHTGWTTSAGPKNSGDIQTNNGAGERRGYIRFPLGSIPSGATINSAVLRLTNNGSLASGSTNLINDLGNTDPLLATAATLFTAAGTGANLHTGSWANTGQISLNLNATATNSIQTRIATPGWLAVGLVRGGSILFNFYGYSGGANAPVLAVNYSAVSQLAVTVNTPAPVTPGSITGTATVCSGTTGLVYSITAVPNATSYTWNLPIGWTLNTGAGTTSITATAGMAGNNGNITVTATNSCGTSASSTLAATVTQQPTISNAGAAQSICLPTTMATLAANTPVVGTGVWSVVSGPSTLATQFSNVNNPAATFTRAGGAGTYQLRWTITNGTCSSTSTVNIVYTNAPGTPNISFNQVMNVYTQTIVNCGPIGGGGQNDVDIYNYSIPFGATFNWQYSTNAGPWTNSGISNTATEYPVAAFGSILGTHRFRLIMTVGGCVVTSNVVTLTVNPTSSIGGVTASSCSGTAFSATPTGLPGGTTYTWTAPTVTGGMTGGNSGSGASITGNLTNNTTTAQTATYTVTPVYTDPASCAATFTVTVTVNPRPTISATPTTQTKCSGVAITTINISNPNGIPGTTFSWTRNNTVNLTGIPNSGSGATITGTFNNGTATAQTSTFTLTATLGTCSSTTTVAVTVNPRPVANAGGNQTICTTLTSTVIGAATGASGGTGPYGYSWSPVTGLSATNINNPTATPPSYPYTYTLVVTDANGCASTGSNTIISQGSVTKTWNGDGVSGGTGGNDFNNPQNWLPKGVPSDCNDVVMNVNFTSFILGTVANIDFSANSTIKSLSTQLSGFQALNFTPTIFRLNVANRSFTILNNTSLTTNCTGFPVAASITQVSVGAGGVVTYGGNLTTSGTAATNQVMPFYAATNNTGKMYVKGNATLNGIASDVGNKPAQIIFDGTGTQTINHNSGTQIIYLGATSTDVGETNAPTVILAGAGTGGFRNLGNLNVLTNATLDVAQQVINRNSVGGSINLSAGSFLKLGRNSGGVGTSNFPTNYATYNFNATSTVDYNSALAQTVYNVPLYGNLTLSNALNKVASGNINVQKNVTIQGAALFLGGTRTITLGGNWTNYNQTGFSEQTSVVIFNGTGAQSINTTGGEIFYDLRKTANGTLTQLSDVAVQGGGTSAFTLSAGIYDAGTFRFNSSASPLNISAGLLKLARLNTLLPEFDIATYAITGGAIELYGNGTQQLRGARDYRDLIFSNTGTKTTSAAIPNITGTILVKNLALLDVGTYQMGGTGTNLTMTDAAVYRTAGTGTKPDALGTYTLNAGTTIDFSHNIPGATEDIRMDLPVYSNLVVSGNQVANPTTATSIPFQTGGTFTVKNGGIFKLGNSAGFTGSTTTAVSNANTPGIILEQGSSIEYYGGPSGTNNQIITNEGEYEGLILSGSSTKTAPSSVLTVNGNMTNTGSAFNHNTGTLLFDGSQLQQYFSTGTELSFYQMNVNNPVNLEVNGPLSIERQLSLGVSGKLNLLSADITLKSGINYTAAVDKILQNDAIAYGTGQFVVERYIATGTSAGQHIKSWQFLAIPLLATQTMKEAWQEGAATPNANPVPGYGTQLTSNLSGATGLGFDVFTAPGPSIKIYNSVSNGWNGLPNTQSLSVTNPKGYMTFVRGDRSVTAFNQAATPTILRAKGKLYMPSSVPSALPPVATVAANKFEAIGNPYASTIDFEQITRSGDVDAKFYVWDPLLTSNYNGLGGYQTISQANGWKPIPGGTAHYDANIAYKQIQSGQAFLVYSTGTGGSLTFTEAAKMDAHKMVFRQQTQTQSLGGSQFFRMQLQVGTPQNFKLADGNAVVFHSSYQTGIDASDAIKMINTGENAGITNGERNLALDARPFVVTNDSIHYQLTNLRRQTYQFTFNPEGMADAGLEAWLVDRFLNTQTAISLSAVTTQEFTVTDQPQSAASNRFYVVFKALQVVPVQFTYVSASRTGNQQASVNWRTENEWSVSNYTIEKSTDGRNFEFLAEVAVKANNGSGAAYQYTDLHAGKNKLYYQIRANNLSSAKQYSQIAYVNALHETDQFSVYPNPVVGRKIQIQYKSTSSKPYHLTLINTSGQVVQQVSMSLSGTNSNWKLSAEIASGIYQLSILSSEGVETVLQLFIP